MPLFNVTELTSELRTKTFMWDSRLSESLHEYSERKLNEQANSFSSLKKYDIFLSHSTKDAAAILRLARIMEECGLSVYVDWIEDKQLNRSKVAIETAKIIRERLKASRCLIMALTENSTQSSWVQWGLGLGDGQKNGKVAILPLISEGDKDTKFYKQEYLGLYPYVDHVAGTIYVNGKIWLTLNDWLSKTNPLEQILYS